jgi:hypothetical protein
MKLPNHLFIVGTPCSGTKALTEFLNGCLEGNVQFENLWETAPGGIYIDWKAPLLWDKFPEARVIHWIRDPIAQMNSMFHLQNWQNCIMTAETLCPGLLSIPNGWARLAHFWCRWNDVIATRGGPVVRMEEFDPPQTNSHAKEKLITWDNYGELIDDDSAIAALEARAANYGY